MVGSVFDKTFVFEESANVRCVIKDGESWFVAQDVCTAIGIQLTGWTLKSLDEDERGWYLIPTPGGPQNTAVVSEGGLYTLIMRSRAAVTPGTVSYRFRRWVTHEVLPSIRKTGSYGITMRLLGDLLEVDEKTVNACISFVSEQDRLLREARKRQEAA